MTGKKPTKTQKRNAVLYLRCVETYAEYICDHIDDMGALDYYELDDVVDEIIGVKSDLLNVLETLFREPDKNG